LASLALLRAAVATVAQQGARCEHTAADCQHSGDDNSNNQPSNNPPSNNPLLSSESPFPELNQLKQPILCISMLRYRHNSNSDRIVCAAGCLDGNITVSVHSAVAPGYDLISTRQTRVNGPVSTIKLYLSPHLLETYSNGDCDVDTVCNTTPSVSLFVSAAVGYCVVYDNVTLGFRSYSLLGAHIWSNFYTLSEQQSQFGSFGVHNQARKLGIGCCDSILCFETRLIARKRYLLFGCYSGKLACYLQTHDLSDAFELVFECQFDQQIHALEWLCEGAFSSNLTDCAGGSSVVLVGAPKDSVCHFECCLAVITLYQIHLLPIQSKSETLVADTENIVSL
jgi:hypothetical protein